MNILSFMIASLFSISYIFGGAAIVWMSFKATAEIINNAVTVMKSSSHRILDAFKIVTLLYLYAFCSIVGFLVAGSGILIIINS